MLRSLLLSLLSLVKFGLERGHVQTRICASYLDISGIDNIELLNSII